MLYKQILAYFIVDYEQFLQNLHQIALIYGMIVTFDLHIKIPLNFTKEIVFANVSQTCCGITIIASCQPQNVVFPCCAFTNAPGMGKSPVLGCILQFATAFTLLN